tara:strand:+ start:223 stop:432 length:210 start_codon:yes stop_codon:yes gene_type:complete
MMKTEMKSKVIARAQVIVDPETGSGWGGDRSISQLYNQAAKDAENRVRRVLQDAKYEARILSNTKPTPK